MTPPTREPPYPCPPPPQPDPSDGTASAMLSLATGLVSWLLIGAVGYTRWWPAGEPFLIVVVTAALGMAQFIALLLLSDSAAQLWPRSARVYQTTAVLGFGATAAYAVLGSVWARHPCRGVFCSLAGVYLGLAVEGVTGVCGRVRAAWAATVVSSESQVRERDQDRARSGPKRD